MVKSLIFVGTLKCRYISGRFNDQDSRLVPQRIGADRAGVRVREILAACASFCGLPCRHYGRRQGLGILIIHSKDVEGKALRRLAAYTRKTAELCYEILN